MIFFVDYDRRRGMVVEFKAFDDRERDAARRYRLDAELRVREQLAHREIVLLEAVDEAQVRKTHRRYFEGIESFAMAQEAGHGR